MQRKKKASKEVQAQIGPVKIPLKFVAGILAVLGIGGGGGALAGQTMAAQKHADEMQQLQIDMAEVKNDLKWIKQTLSAGDRLQSERQQEPSKP